MRSTFHGIELGKSALYAQQKALTTTGQNIANANTKGYSRQQVNFSSSIPVDLTIGNRIGHATQLGTGVEVKSITRARDSFSDEQFRNENAHLGEWSQMESVLLQAEMAFQEPSDSGLHAATNRFFNAWHDLSTEPTNMAIRQVVVQSAQDVVSTSKQINLSLSNLKDNVANTQSRLVNQANDYLERINHLNSEIVRFGEGANDLKDERDLLVDELSKIVAISVKPQDNGSFNIHLKGSGDPLIVNGTITSINDSSKVQGGSLYGAIQAEAAVVDKMEKLEEYIKSFIHGEVKVQLPDGEVVVEGVNGLHKIGYSLREDTSDKSMQGIELFVGSSKDNFSIDNINVNTSIINDVSLLAASSKVDGNGQSIKGNGDIAFGIGKLREAQFSFNNTKTGAIDKVTPSQYFTQFMTELGIEAKAAKHSVATFNATTSAIDERRQSISGVSLDEEMANLIKFQHAYNAAARVVTTVDEMLDTVINRLGAR